MLAEAGIGVAARTARRTSRPSRPRTPELTWDFIGQLQSRKVKQILPLVRWSTRSRATRVARAARAPRARRRPRCSSRSTSRASRARAASTRTSSTTFIAPLPGARASGLMTMPPLAGEPEDSRRWFAALRELAGERGLRAAVDGHVQDYAVAVAGGRDHRANRHEAVTAGGGGAGELAGESPADGEPDTNGFPRLLAQRARLLRPGRGVTTSTMRRTPARGGARGPLPRAAQRPPPGAGVATSSTTSSPRTTTAGGALDDGAPLRRRRARKR